MEEGPTRPAAAAAKGRTSRWKAVANTALQRGFGRLSEGDFDQGNLPEESGTHVVVARSEAETLPTTTIVSVGNGGAVSTAAPQDVTELAPSPPAGPSDPAQPVRPHAKPRPRSKPAMRTHRSHAGASVF